MLYAVLISFAFATHHGRVISDERFDKAEACEEARAKIVELFRSEWRENYGETELTITEAHCGLAAEFGATPV